MLAGGGVGEALRIWCVAALRGALTGGLCPCQPGKDRYVVTVLSGVVKVVASGALRGGLGELVVRQNVVDAVGSASAVVQQGPPFGVGVASVEDPESVCLSHEVELFPVVVLLLYEARSLDVVAVDRANSSVGVDENQADSPVLDESVGLLPPVGSVRLKCSCGRRRGPQVT